METILRRVLSHLETLGHFSHVQHTVMRVNLLPFSPTSLLPSLLANTHMRLQGYFKKNPSCCQALLKTCASLFKLLADSQCFLQFRFIMLTLHRSLLKITGIRWHAVLNERIHKVHLLVKTVRKTQVMSSRGWNLSFYLVLHLAEFPFISMGICFDERHRHLTIEPPSK